MYFGLSQDQLMLQESVGRFLEKTACLEDVRTYVAGAPELADRIETGLSELGLPLMLIDEADGGLSMGLLEAALVQMMLGRYVAPGGYIGRYVLAPLALSALPAGSERETLLTGYIAGQDRYAVGLTEIIGGRDGAGIAVRQGRLSGRASFVFDWHGATHILIPVDGCLYRVETAKGQVQELTTIDLTRPTVMVDFDQVEATCLSENFSATASALIDAGRTLLAADSFGAAEMMLEKAVAYAKEREQFGRVIGSFQAVKHLCADLAAALEPCRALVWYAAYAFSAVPEEAPLMSRLVKSRLADVGQNVARGTTEVHGGMGFTDLLGLHYWFKRIGMNRQWLGGPTQIRAEAALLQGWCEK